MVLMGDTFLRNFYSVYDAENLQVKLAVNKEVTWNASINPKDGLSGWAIFGIIAGCLAALALIVCLIISCKKKNAQSQKLHEESANMINK